MSSVIDIDDLTVVFGGVGVHECSIPRQPCTHVLTARARGDVHLGRALQRACRGDGPTPTPPAGGAGIRDLRHRLAPWSTTPTSPAATPRPATPSRTCTRRSGSFRRSWAWPLTPTRPATSTSCLLYTSPSPRD